MRLRASTAEAKETRRRCRQSGRRDCRDTRGWTQNMSKQTTQISHGGKQTPMARTRAPRRAADKRRVQRRKNVKAAPAQRRRSRTKEHAQRARRAMQTTTSKAQQRKRTRHREDPENGEAKNSSSQKNGRSDKHQQKHAFSVAVPPIELKIGPSSLAREIKV